MFGTHPVKEAIKQGRRRIIQLFCTKNQISQFERFNIKTQIVDDNHLNKLVGKDTVHQGIIALVESNTYYDLDVSLLNNSTKIVILDQITDPHNIGAIIRSATAFGVDTIILQNKNSPDENGIIAKTASGTLEYINYVKVVNISKTIKDLQNNGFWVLGMDGSAKRTIKDYDFPEKVALVMGAEGSGMRDLVMKSCDELLKIPMNSKVESLNVSNAAAICFYELDKK